MVFFFALFHIQQNISCTKRTATFLLSSVPKLNYNQINGWSWLQPSIGQSIKISSLWTGCIIRANELQDEANPALCYRPKNCSFIYRKLKFWTWLPSIKELLYFERHANYASRAKCETASPQHTGRNIMFHITQFGCKKTIHSLHHQPTLTIGPALVMIFLDLVSIRLE
jgi:hypothetical protein